MDENFEVVTDLFGHPAQVGYGQRGRPAYQATERDRNQIKLLLALGWSIPRMANAIGVSPATVKRYFRAELRVRDAMRDRLDARRFEIAMEQANAGNVAALKLLNAMIDRSDQMGIEEKLAKAESAPPKERLGKKVLDAKKGIDADADLMAELEREAAQNVVN